MPFFFNMSCKGCRLGSLTYNALFFKVSISLLLIMEVDILISKLAILEMVSIIGFDINVSAC